MTKETASIHVQAKLTPTEFKPLQEIIDKTNIKKATLVKQVILANMGNVSLPKESTSDKQRLVFLANKASNNINQIAKKLNEAHRGEIITEKIFFDTLNNLISLEKYFRQAIDKC